MIFTLKNGNVDNPVNVRFLGVSMGSRLK